MGDWQSRLRLDLRDAISEAAPHWLDRFALPTSGFSLHLAVLVEPYLEWVLSGRKTIESRFSINRVAPYGVIRAGDRLLLKRSSGPVVGICSVTAVEFFELDSGTRAKIRNSYSSALCAEDSGFWAARRRATYATLMHIGEVYRLPPVICTKRDRRGWVVLPGASIDDQIALPGGWTRRSNRERKI